MRQSGLVTQKLGVKNVSMEEGDVRESQSTLKFSVIFCLKNMKVLGKNKEI